MRYHQLVFSFTAFLFMAPIGAAQERRSEKRIVAYFTEWSIYQRKYNVADIPADKLTHVNYAFAKIQNGECALFDTYAAIDKAHPGDTWDPGVLRGNFKQLQVLKKKHPHLKTLISVGGWTLSSPFSDAALTPASRSKLAKSCVAFMKKYAFDGIDIDWEYPVGGGLESNKTRPEDKQNYTLLLAELRQELDAQGKLDKARYLLTIAAPAGPSTLRNLELAKIADHCDWINVMTYDFHGSWSPLTHFNAPLFAIREDPTKDETIRVHFNVDSAVKAYLKAGVAPSKVVVGAPFYGRGWAGVKDVNRGLFQPHNKQPPKGTWEAGVFDFKDLEANYLGKIPRYWHEEAKAPWLFDEKKGIMISYDDAESLKRKAEYVNENRLGGVMVWELSADNAKNTLVRTLYDALRGK